ncbi:MAG: histidine kinase N-terminal 7TM domain-containing protein [Lachnospiraceae bacterium]|nr:histidine kinase N-terminal 7TM domain-containing protein [Lachnospiraceae bacterium]
MILVSMVILQVLCIVLAVLALTLVILGEATREQRGMANFMFVVLIFNVAYLLEMTAASAEEAFVALRMEYLGSAWVALFFLRFIACYCGVKLPQRLMLALAAGNFLSMIAVFTNSWHHLFYREMSFVQGGVFPHLAIEYGPLFWLFFLSGGVIPYAFSMRVLLQSIREQKKEQDRHKLFMFASMSFIPLLLLVLRSCGVTGEYDPLPASLALLLSLIVIFIWNKQIYNLGDMAAHTALRTLDDGVIMLDAELNIMSFNPAASRIFVDLKEECIGRNVSEVNCFPEDFFEQRAKKEFSVADRYYETHMKPVMDTKGKLQGYVLLYFDITDTRTYIDELNTLRERAETANEAKGDFLTNISQEIKTPLNAIKGLSDLIKEESRGRRVYDFACDIEEASGRLLTLMNSILDLSNAEEGKLSVEQIPYYVKSMIQEVLQSEKAAAEKKRLSLTYEIAKTMPCMLAGDVNKIQQILRNILNNAVKYTDHGAVHVKVWDRALTEGRMELCCRIEDTGIGIEQKDMDSIFEDFIKADSINHRSSGGVGLGLAIAKRFITLMNGTIEVESVQGEGSAFTLTIPQIVIDKRTIEENAEKQEKKQTSLLFTARGYRVLVVDDNTINRKVARGLLKEYECDITEAESGMEAIELVRETRFDLIFMDHLMPQMDGIQTVSVIRKECGENGADVVIIALTATVLEGARDMFLSHGFQDYLEKPMSRATLYRMLNKWIPEECRQPRNHFESRASSKADNEIILPGVDVRATISQHGGSVQNYLELLYLFELEGRQKASYLENLVAKKDYRNYEMEVHALKGATANLGMEELAQKAKQMELAVNSEDFTYVNEQSDPFFREYRSMLSAVHQVLVKQNYLTEKRTEDNK